MQQVYIMAYTGGSIEHAFIGPVGIDTGVMKENFKTSKGYDDDTDWTDEIEQDFITFIGERYGVTPTVVSYF